jgi:hypothetical protein
VSRSEVEGVGLWDVRGEYWRGGGGDRWIEGVWG